jgi:hypothetical protein
MAVSVGARVKVGAGVSVGGASVGGSIVSVGALPPQAESRRAKTITKGSER